MLGYAFLTLPVFALFRAAIRIIDTTKRAALQQLLLQSVIATGPGERLDDKLAAMALPTTFGDRMSM
jgi:hypothetical protein